MRTTPSTTTRFGAAACRLAAVAALAVVLGGCASSTRSGTALATAPIDPTTGTFDTAAGRAPTAKTLYRLGRMLVAQQRNTQADAVLRSTIERYPRFLPAYCELAALHVRRSRVDAAIETLEAALRIAPYDAVLSNDLGMCWMIKGDYDEAVRHFSRARSYAPYEARYTTNMALASGMMGDYDRALDLYKEVLQPPRAHYNLAVICSARQDEERAAREYALAARGGKGEN